MKFRIIIVSALLYVACFSAYAGDFQKGVDAYENGDYQTALREWQPFAEQGFAAAQYNLGQMYAQGQGMPQNNAEAVKWYRKAAEQGYAVAQFNLGVMYHDGKGVPQNDADAAKWYREAAEQGVAEAQYNLGVVYAQGRGVLQDYVKSHMWLNIAGSNGSSQAIVNRDSLAKLMTPQQIQQAQTMAADWAKNH